jgi:hypothetical protein
MEIILVATAMSELGGDVFSVLIGLYRLLAIERTIAVKLQQPRYDVDVVEEFPAARSSNF